MPDIVGQQLDRARVKLAQAGVPDDVELVGGGVFGVIDETNWVVCEQSPLPGQAVTSTPMLAVERDCGGGTVNTAAADQTVDPSTTQTNDTLAPQASEDITTTAAPATTVPASPVPLTVTNSLELVAVLQAPDNCDDSIETFGAKYRGQTIEFDGNLAFLSRHGSYETRFDFLIYGGDYSDTMVVGAAMKFEDKNAFELGLVGTDSISQGDNLHIVAEVLEYREASCLLMLDPISVALR